MHVFYLHGFASSPGSSKAAYLAGRLRERGVELACPDFNQPAFETMTISRMLAQLDDAIARLPRGPVTLIGSSLGGLVAVEAAHRRADSGHPIAQLILLAPAVELAWDRWDEIGPGGLERWRRSGYIEVFHYAFGERRRLEYRLLRGRGALPSRAAAPRDADDRDTGCP